MIPMRVSSFPPYFSSLDLNRFTVLSASSATCRIVQCIRVSYYVSMPPMGEGDLLTCVQK